MSTERDAGSSPRPSGERPGVGVVLVVLIWAVAVYGCYVAGYLR